MPRSEISGSHGKSMVNGRRNVPTSTVALPHCGGQCRTLNFYMSFLAFGFFDFEIGSHRVVLGGLKLIMLTGLA